MIRLGIVGGFPSEETVAGLYLLDHIGLIVSAGSYWLYRIVWIISSGSYQETLAFMRWLVFYWMYRTDGLYSTLMGRGWDGPTLAGARTGTPPLMPEQERHHWLLRGVGMW